MKDTEIKNLKNDIKSGKLKKMYLLYGDEKYLVKHYEKELLNVAQSGIDSSISSVNIDTFDGKSNSVEDIINASESIPFLAEKRVVHIKDSGMFTSGRKNDSEKMTKYIEDTPNTTVLIFVESDVDKRNKLYKNFKKLGCVIEINKQSESQLISWIISIFKKENLDIARITASYLIKYSSGDMNSIFSEIQKLISYKGYKGSDTIPNTISSTISNQDIEDICTKSLESKIFDLVEAIGNNDSKTALDIYSNLTSAKGSPIMILTMIARQFRLILQCLHLSQNKMSSNEIAEKIEARSFTVKDCLSQSRNFTVKMLINALNDCIETDINIKTGKMDSKLAVEILIIKYSSNKMLLRKEQASF